MNCPAVLGQELTLLLQPSPSAPELGDKDQTTGSGRTTGVLDGRGIFA
jgi:hypothetical protein